mgnify:CR=1 FL=1
MLDTGLDLAHPEIQNSLNVSPGIDLITNIERGGDGDGIDADAQDAGDRCGARTENSFHGTHVAGIIGAQATNDRIGVAGGALIERWGYPAVFWAASASALLSALSVLRSRRYARAATPA